MLLLLPDSTVCGGSFLAGRWCAGGLNPETQNTVGKARTPVLLGVVGYRSVDGSKSTNLANLESRKTSCLALEVENAWGVEKTRLKLGTPQNSMNQIPLTRGEGVLHHLNCVTFKILKAEHCDELF